MFNKKAFGEAKVGGGETKYEQFPDGWSGRVVVESIHILEEGHFGPRYIAEFKSAETGQRGSMSRPLTGGGAAYTYRDAKTLYAVCLGMDPKRDKDRIQEEVTMDVHEAATTKNVFRGHVIDIVKVSYKVNKNNPAKPFVNFTFAPVVGEDGLPLTQD